MDNDFGTYVRSRREALRAEDRNFSLRQVTARVGIEPSYLSKIERGDQPPPGENTIIAIANEIGEDPDVLLALAGKVSTDLRDAILKRPALFAELIRELKNPRPRRPQNRPGGERWRVVTIALRPIVVRARRAQADSSLPNTSSREGKPKGPLYMSP